MTERHAIYLAARRVARRVADPDEVRYELLRLAQRLAPWADRQELELLAEPFIHDIAARLRERLERP